MEQRENQTISVTMTREAAERFKKALTYGDSLAATHAEAMTGEAARGANEHSEWLAWGRGRVEAALRDA
jgi:hypothetical protein